MAANQLAPHELLEMHELLASEVTVAQKLQASMGMVQNPQLKTVMQACLATKQSNITQMTQLLQTTNPTIQ